MGIFSFLFGNEKEQKPEAQAVQAAAPAAAVPAGIPQEVISAIAAAVCAMSERPCVCFRIQPGQAWVLDGRIKAAAPQHLI